MEDANRAIKDFLFARMYRHWRVNRMTAKARRLDRGSLFACSLPTRRCCRTTGAPGPGRGLRPRAAVTVCDYVAGMTDRYAIEEHRRLTDITVSG